MAAAVVAAVVVWAVTRDADDAPAAETVELDDLVADPGTFLGREVSVVGEVGQAVGEGGFVLHSSDGLVQVLVVAAPADVAESLGQSVRVLGEVQPFDAAGVEPETIEHERLAAIVAGPVVVAETAVLEGAGG